ncbi:MAG: ATP-dependent helicase [Solirubrobacteraceae bacterium]
MASERAAERIDALLDGLNEPQREAVTHGEGPLLILAGAGSGKTRVLTHRVAFLLFTGQVRSWEVLAITFTNKSASEMRERVQRLIGEQTRGMWLMTFHAACARILRAQAELLGYTRSFTIYDQADSRRLVKRTLEDLGVDVKRFTPAAIQSQISHAKNRLRSPSRLREEAGSAFEELLAEAYRLYQRELEAHNAMDFDDLLAKTVQLFEAHQDVRRRYSHTFRHVLVDEYQDTNRAQYGLLRLLVDGEGEGEGHRNLAVVGDDSQSIYSFRGAEVRNILDFERDFPDARVVKLEQNYRSTQTILSAANAVIEHNESGIAKRLWSELGEGEQIAVRSLPDEHAEARFLVGEIERLLDDGASRAEIAVLYRVNAMSRVIEDALTRREIAYQVIGGTKFYERAEIKDAIAYLSLLTNPHDVVSFQRIVNSPRRGIGQASVAKVLAHASSTEASVWDVAANPGSVPGLGAAAAKALRRFFDTMGELRELARGPDVPVAELLEQTLQRSGYVDALETEAKESARWNEAEGRLENLEQLIDVAREFDESDPAAFATDEEIAAAGADAAASRAGAAAVDADLNAAAAADVASAAESDPLAAEPPPSPLDRFLQDSALRADSDSRRDEAGLVTLMTMHNAKGLEYPIVFIAACEEGVFPHSRALDEGGIEEERRLFYVGITRAMRKLYLTYARSRRLFGDPAPAIESSFIEEIPSVLVEFDEEQGRLGSFGGPSPRRRAEFAGAWAAMAGGRDEVAARAASGVRARDLEAPRFRLGEDIVHAAFGEGVVTGVEPDGVIVVRFAGDGSERKLVAEYAPLSRR